MTLEICLLDGNMGMLWYILDGIMNGQNQENIKDKL
jgi:hypothetical protein